MTKKEEFIKYVDTYIKRDGIKELMEWLENDTDFFTAPASTKYHSSFEGGLCVHSINVFKRFCAEHKAVFPDANGSEVAESIAICALFHDLCKANIYVVETRNVKNKELNVWEEVPFYTCDPKMPIGHGCKSIILLQRFIKLTDKEIFAIYAHMGNMENDKDISNIYGRSTFALLLHIADMKATFIDE